MRRLFEDPESSTALRDDLLRSRAAGQDYPTADKLAQLQAALADPARVPLARSGAQAPLGWRGIHPGWKLAALLAASGTAALVLRPTARPPASAVSTPPPPPAAVVAEEEPAAVERAADEGPSSSRREISQLVQIRALLQQDPLAAYQLALRSEQEFPHGVLSEERQALAIVALHKAGKRAAAAARARDFFTRFPQSPMRGTIEAELHRERK